MKKIIFGCLFDTSTAEEIGSWSNDGREGFGYVEETLYRKESGELFLHVKTSPDIYYAHQLSYLDRLNGETIICEPYFFPAEWAEEKLDADTYLELFGHATE